MSRTLVLTILLIAQFGLVTFISLHSSDKMTAFQSNESLLQLESGLVNRFEIQDKELGKTVILKKQDKAWVIASEEDFPVADKKVDQLLDKLVALTKTWPVATSDQSAKTFKVTADDFNKKLTFKNGDNLISNLILGTAPSFNTVHARVDGDVNTYSLQFNATEVSAKAEDWENKDILKVSKDKIEEIVINGLVLKKDDKAAGGFALTLLSENASMKKDGVLSLVDKVTGLRYLKVLGKENKHSYRQDEPYFTFSLKVADKTIEYRVSEAEEKDLYVLKSSELPYYFSMPPYVMQNMKKIDRMALIDITVEATPEVSATPSETALEVATASAVATMLDLAETKDTSTAVATVTVTKTPTETPSVSASVTATATPAVTTTPASEASATATSTVTATATTTAVVSNN